MNIKNIIKASCLSFIILCSTHAFGAKDITIISGKASSTYGLVLELNTKDNEFISYKVYDISADKVRMLRIIHNDKSKASSWLNVVYGDIILEDDLEVFSNKILLKITDPYEYIAYLGKTKRLTEELISSKENEFSTTAAVTLGATGVFSVFGILKSVAEKRIKLFVASVITAAIYTATLVDRTNKNDYNENFPIELENYLGNTEVKKGLNFVQISEESEISLNELKMVLATEHQENEI